MRMEWYTEISSRTMFWSIKMITAKLVVNIVIAADFNVSTMLEKDQSDKLQNSEGTIYFYAPEMCNQGNFSHN